VSDGGDGGAAAQERIEQAIARLGADREPPPGWQARVLAEVAIRGRGRGRVRWWHLVVPALSAATVGFVLVAWLATSSAKATVELSIRRISARQVVRGGEDFLLGDRLEVRASCGGTRCSFRAYRDDRLLLACPGDPGCRVADGASSAEVGLDHLGGYLVVAFPASAASIVEDAGGTLDGDLSRLRAADVVVRQWSFLVR